MLGQMEIDQDKILFNTLHWFLMCEANGHVILAIQAVASITTHKELDEWLVNNNYMKFVGEICNQYMDLG